MKTNMTISIDKEAKLQFTSFAKSLGTNPTNLANMLIRNSLNTRSITFSTSSNLDLEFESFTQEQVKSLQRKSLKNTQKLEKLLA